MGVQGPYYEPMYEENFERLEIANYNVSAFRKPLREAILLFFCFSAEMIGVVRGEGAYFCIFAECL